jgi:hypothetical protein
MRIDLSKIETEMEHLQEINLELSKFVFHVKKFSNSCILKNDIKRNIYKLAEAKSHLLSCLTIIKNKIESENNDLINDYKTSNQINQKDIDDYFDNFLSIIDTNQKQLIKDIQNSEDNIISGLTVQSSIKNFMEELKDGMENVVLYPITSSIRIYTSNNFEDKWKEISKRKLFKFILFRCVLISAKIKGSEKRQKASLSSTAIGSTFHETNIIKPGKNQVRQREQEINEEFHDKEIDDFEDIFAGDEI